MNSEKRVENVSLGSESVLLIYRVAGLMAGIKGQGRVLGNGADFEAAIYTPRRVAPPLFIEGISFQCIPCVCFAIYAKPPSW